jgi:F-type H+-transporting ATPase subunit b
MIKLSILCLALEKSGGLFDFDGTLPLIAFQFLILMIILNIILYTPLLNIITERDEYINKNLVQASAILIKANNLNSRYEIELLKLKKEAQLEILTLQKLHKNLLEKEIKTSQKIFDNYLIDVISNLEIDKSKILIHLEKEINSLSSEIMMKIIL